MRFWPWRHNLHASLVQLSVDQYQCIMNISLLTGELQLKWRGEETDACWQRNSDSAPL